MTPTPTPLTADEQTALEEYVADLKAHGYREIDNFRGLQPGARIHHRGERWYDAYVTGTATIIIVLRHPDSPWERTYRRPGIELVAHTDRDRFGTGIRLMKVADYHVALADDQPPALTA